MTQIRLLVGDMRARLAELPAGSVHSVTTSIPYYGLRSYASPPQVWGGCQAHAHGFTDLGERPDYSQRPKRDHAGPHAFGDTRGTEDWRANTAGPSSRGAICDHEHTWGDVIPGESRGSSGTPTTKNGRGEGYGRGEPRGRFCVEPCEHEWQTVTTPATNGLLNHAIEGETKNGDAATRAPRDSRICARGCGAWLGELGLEPTWEMFLEHVQEAFRAVWRVLRDDGTLWLNVGDSYSGSNNGSNDHRQLGKHYRRGVTSFNTDKYRGQKPGRQQGIRSKSMMNMPARVAIALGDDPECGWIQRSEITWCKTNPMPESTRTRATRATEKIYMFVKSGDPLFWLHPTKGGARKKPKPDFVWIDKAADNAETAVEPPDWRTERMHVQDVSHKGACTCPKRWRRFNLWEGFDYFYDDIAAREAHASAKTRTTWGIPPKPDSSRQDSMNSVKSTKWAEATGPRQPGLIGEDGEPMGRNMLDYWMVSSDPCPDAHFATFPREIPERTIKVGTSEKGACPSCGAPWARLVERAKGSSWHDHDADLERGQRTDDMELTGANYYRHYAVPKVIGWTPTCECFCGECQGDGSDFDLEKPAGSAAGTVSVVNRRPCSACAGTGKPKPIPCVELDPFGGSGRTAVAADRLGRDAIIVELKPSYALIAHATMSKESPLFTRIECDPPLTIIQELARDERNADRAYRHDRPDDAHADSAEPAAAT